MISTNLWQQYFKCYELDEIMRQKDDKSWAELLNRLREGNHTDIDIKTLKSMILSPKHPDYPINGPSDLLIVIIKCSVYNQCYKSSFIGMFIDYTLVLIRYYFLSTHWKDLQARIGTRIGMMHGIEHTVYSNSNKVQCCITVGGSSIKGHPRG